MSSKTLNIDFFHIFYLCIIGHIKSIIHWNDCYLYAAKNCVYMRHHSKNSNVKKINVFQNLKKLYLRSGPPLPLSQRFTSFVDIEHWTRSLSEELPFGRSAQVELQRSDRMFLNYFLVGYLQFSQIFCQFLKQTWVILFQVSFILKIFFHVGCAIT